MTTVNRLLVLKHYRLGGGDDGAAPKTLAVSDFVFSAPVIISEIRILSKGAKAGAHFTGETQEAPFSLEVFAKNLETEGAPFETLTRGAASISVKKGGARITRIKPLRTSHVAFRGRYHTLSVGIYGRNPLADPNINALASIQLPAFDLPPALKLEYVSADAPAADAAAVRRLWRTAPTLRK
eukprot:CAMPEP_0118862834 /NCGR_PEP_ID=MMETSP1163-20130328/7914_1 /TAXON_ID=124430 /ORGANISM="Phaeomonas parva, Strain CCMP2877" /LENGTH=181 /DNA_ID=CAMNT_0006796777 /DNA_START=117 /DNA_END=659 /DNA_ORIENTATION=+